MDKKKDRRVVRTEKAFQEAFLNLAENNKKVSLTVSDIAEEAGYSRNAFYAHFESKEQFIIWLIRNEAMELRKVMNWRCEKETDEEQIERARYQADLLFFEHIYKNRQFYKLLFENAIIDAGIDYMCAVYFENLSYDTQLVDVEMKKGKLDWELISYSIIYQYMGMIKWWIQNEFRQSPVYMAEQKWNIRHKLILKD